MAWLKLTAPDGQPVHINSVMVARVRQALFGSEGAVLDFGGDTQAVRESVTEIMALLNGEQER